MVALVCLLRDWLVRPGPSLLGNFLVAGVVGTGFVVVVLVNRCRELSL